MKRCLTFTVLLGSLTAAALLMAQMPPRMALPTGGLTPPKLSAPPMIAPPATNPAPKAATTAAPAAPILVAAQPVFEATPAKPLTPPVLPAANPFDPGPTTAAATPAAQPEWHVVQKPMLPPTSRYDRTAMQIEPPRSANRIRDCLLKASAEVQLPAQEAGVLVELKAAEGLEVTINQPLGRIDDAQPRLQRKAAEAERAVSFEKSKSTISERYAAKASDVAKQEWQKAVESNDRAPNSVSQVEVMRLKLTWEKGLLEYERAQEERKVETLTVQAKDVDVEAADDAIRRRQLIAPITGTIVELTPHVGEWLKPGDPVLKIVNMETLKIEGYVNITHHRQEDLRNQTVLAEVDQGHQKVAVPARIIFVSPVVEPGGEYRIKAEIQNRKNQTGEWELKPGLNAELVLKAVPGNP